MRGVHESDIELKCKLADAPESEKRKGPSTVDRWSYVVISPGTDQLMFCIKGMHCQRYI